MGVGPYHGLDNPPSGNGIDNIFLGSEKQVTKGSQTVYPNSGHIKHSAELLA